MCFGECLQCKSNRIFSTWEYYGVNRNIDVSINCCLLLDRNNKLDVIIVLIYDILSKTFV